MRYLVFLLLSGNTGNNTPETNDNMQLSLAVYIWERTA